MQIESLPDQNEEVIAVAQGFMERVTGQSLTGLADSIAQTARDNNYKYDRINERI
ncbi:hypothetical protein [Paenibacillus sp. CF384]|uniref:hypothetical protein n=1 Tax=Paenibacillus sp. CF384 TaxID=1884382 RepID=UPI0015A52F42|nr:hypothetical protein [Paenibacillus sp. CF384]